MIHFSLFLKEHQIKGEGRTRSVLFQNQSEVPSKGSPMMSVLFSARKQQNVFPLSMRALIRLISFTMEKLSKVTRLKSYMEN